MRRNTYSRERYAKVWRRKVEGRNVGIRLLFGNRYESRIAHA